MKKATKCFYSWTLFGVAVTLACIGTSSLCLGSTLSQNEAFWYDGKWPHEHSDLKPDPAISFGRLENGLRYAVIPNNNPPGRVSLYLNVQAGSLMENDNELGFAHLLEHMAFNGSRNFPEGSLIPFFQKNGMSFGGDTNAWTSWGETVYRLDLTSIDPAVVKTGMDILRDFADGLLLEDKAVKDEIGVVLSEKTARDSEQAEIRRARRAFMYSGSRFVNETIGTEATLNAADSASVTAFYKKWYRPERMVLIAVGSADKEAIVKQVRESFGSMKSSGPAPKTASWGDNSITSDCIYRETRSISGVDLSVQVMHRREHDRDSVQNQLESLLDQLAQRCIQFRLAELAQESGDLWTRAIFRNSRDGLLPGVAFSASTSVKNWKKALATLSEEVRRATLHGVTKEEIERARASVRQGIIRHQEELRHISNGDLAKNFIQILNRDRVYTSIEDDIALFDRLTPQFSVDAVNAALRDALNGPCVITMSAAEPASEAEIKSVWDEARVKSPAPYAMKKVRSFPYLKEPELKGKLPVLKQRALCVTDDSAPVLHSAKLPNGVELHFLPVRFEKDHISAELQFGPSYDEMTEREVIVAMLAGSALMGSGLGDMEPMEARQVYEKLGGPVKENYGITGATISGSCSRAEVENLLRALWTQFTDPHVRQTGLERSVMNLSLKHRTRMENLDELDKAEGMAFLHGGGRHWRPLEAEEASSVDIAEIERLITKARTQYPVRLFVSGDVEPAAILELCTRLFGSLPSVEPTADAGTALSPSFPVSQSVSREVPESVDKALVRMAWHLDVKELSDRRSLAARTLAATALREHLRVNLRERMGVAYSPSVQYRMSATENGYAFLMATLTTEKSNVEAVRKFLDELKGWEIRKPFLDRIRAPMLSAVKRNRMTNRMWERQLSGELRTGLPLVQWNNEWVDVLSSITPEEASRALKEMLSAPSAEWLIRTTGTIKASAQPTPGRNPSVKETAK